MRKICKLVRPSAEAIAAVHACMQATPYFGLFEVKRWFIRHDPELAPMNAQKAAVAELASLRKSGRVAKLTMNRGFSWRAPPAQAEVTK